MSDELLNKIFEKLVSMERTMSTLATKEELQEIRDRLDAISEQVAKNTEMESQLSELSSIVDDHTDDIRLLKKALR